MRLKDITLTFSDPSIGLHTTTTNRIVVRALAHNIFQADSTSPIDHYGIPTAEGNPLDDATEEQLYVDTVSSRYLAEHFDQANDTTTVHHPVRKRLDQAGDDTPTVSQASHHAAYDETEDLSSTNELQFVNGRFRTKHANNNAYLNYASAFLEPTPLVTMPNYSGVSGTGYRYATFEFDLSSASSSNINYIDVKLYDFTLASPQNSTGTIPDFKLFVKLIDGTNYTPQPTGSYTSIWLDGNAVLATAVGRTQANYSNASLEPLAVLEPSSSGNTNTSDTKRLILATGTSTSSLKVLVRVGLDMSLYHFLGRVELQTA